MTTPYEEDTLLEEGAKAPEFTLPSYPEGQVKLSDFHGKKNVILAFYPKDSTPGCTKEMCGFSDDLSQFEALDTEVFGVSCDTEASHAKFAAKYGINTKLLADTDRTVGKEYGAIRGDRTTADRVLFLIDKQGVVRYVHEGMPDRDQLKEKIKEL